MRRSCLALLLICMSAMPARPGLAGQGRSMSRDIAEFEAGAARDSMVPDAQYWLGIAYARAKRVDEAGTALTRAIAIDPRYAPAYVALAFQPFRRRPQLPKEQSKGKVPAAWRDSVERARRLLERAFMIDPLTELLPPDIDPREARFQEFMKWYAGMDQFRSQPRASLPSGLLWYRGLLDGRLRRYASAIEDFKALLQRAEAFERDSVVPFAVGTNDYRYILAVLSERANRPADAIEYYQATVANDLGHFMAHVRLAGLYRDNMMLDHAVTEARRATESNPEDATAWREFGEILLTAGRAGDAVAPIAQARERNPRDVMALYVLGMVHQELGRPAEARDAYERFIAMAPATLYERRITEAQWRLRTLP